MSESNNTDLNNHDYDSHDSDENQLWNKNSFKKYMLNVLNLLKFSYSTFLKISSVLFTNIIYQVFNEHNKDSYIMNFEVWKTVFTAERLVQLEKIQQSQYQIKEVKNSIIKKIVKLVMKIWWELESFY